MEVFFREHLHDQDIKEEVALEEIQGGPRWLWQFELSSFNERDTKLD